MERAWEWLGEDHITYAVWDIEAWRKVYVDIFCFKEIHYTADVCPRGTSSMKLYGLMSTSKPTHMPSTCSRIALISPINRIFLSHVEHFLRKHGDHSVQHVAYAVSNLETFVEEMKAKGIAFCGDIKERVDAFGPIKQIFAKRFDADLTPAQGAFYEFVERFAREENRPDDFFSSTVAEELYEDVEKDIVSDDGECFIDFSMFV